MKRQYKVSSTYPHAHNSNKPMDMILLQRSRTKVGCETDRMLTDNPGQVHGRTGRTRCLSTRPAKSRSRRWTMLIDRGLPSGSRPSRSARPRRGRSTPGRGPPRTRPARPAGARRHRRKRSIHPPPRCCGCPPSGPPRDRPRDAPRRPSTTSPSTSATPVTSPPMSSVRKR